ncbi:MAG: aldo/keto reductase [Beijerinckiaceae bacterium]
MPDIPLVEAHGAKIPAIGLGTWQLSGETCTRAVIAALECGYRHIDTAKMYGNEREVGEGLKSGGVPRDQVFVTTKVWRDDLHDGDLQRSAEESLKRLGLDQVDLLLIHWPNRNIPVKEAVRALCDTRARKLTRHIGVSNFPVPLLQEALSVASEPIVTNQCEYHPWLDQTKVLAACRKHAIAFTSYCPLGRGEGPRDPAIAKIAQRHGKTPSQVLLRWHIQQPQVIAIPRSGTPAHIKENIGIADFELSGDNMAAISAMTKANSRIVDFDWAPDWDKAA